MRYPPFISVWCVYLFCLYIAINKNTKKLEKEKRQKNIGYIDVETSKLMGCEEVGPEEFVTGPGNYVR